MSKTRIHDSTRVLASYKEISMSDTIKPNEIPSTKPARPPRRSREEWIRRLKELGWKDGTLLPSPPTAFELPAPARRQIQDDK